jgi:hypothetical protein
MDQSHVHEYPILATDRVLAIVKMRPINRRNRGRLRGFVQCEGTENPALGFQECCTDSTAQRLGDFDRE